MTAQDTKATITAEPAADDAKPAPRPLPPLAAKADDLVALREAVIKSAGVGAGLWITYLGVLLYLLVAAGGVSHKDLFFETPAKLPFLSVDLPLKGFFVLAPALFLILHAYILLHFGLLSGKVAAFDLALREQVDDIAIRTQLRRQLPSNIFVQFLAGPREVRGGLMGLMLWLIALITLVLGPVILLVFMELRFLPYHHEAVTWWQRVAVGLDLVLVWLFWPRIAGLRRDGHDQSGTTERMARFQRILTLIAMITLNTLATLLLLVFATFPGEWLDRRLWPRENPWMPEPMIAMRRVLVAGDINLASRRPESWWSNRLVLSELNVLVEKRLDSEDRIASVPETVSLRNRNLDEAVLIDANLRKADLTGASLRWAAMTGANLIEARMGCPKKIKDGELVWADQDGSGSCTRLNGADLSGARLSGAEAAGATFDGANMMLTELYGADLRDATFISADLWGARLDGVSANRARFHGASLTNVNLRGAILDDAELQAADLSNAKLRGASLVGAQLQGAQLSRADLTAARLQGAFVWRVEADTAELNSADVRTQLGYQTVRCDNPSRNNVCEWMAEHSATIRRGIERSEAASIYRQAALERFDRALDASVPDDPATAEWWKKTRTRPHAEDAHRTATAKEWTQAGCQTAGAPYVNAGIALNLLTSWSSVAVDDQTVRRVIERLLDGKCVGMKGVRSDVRQQMLEFMEEAGR